MFTPARVVKKMACMATAYSSMKIPYRGNTLVIGDAAAYVEVETQGALTCGYRAGTLCPENSPVKTVLRNTPDGGRILLNLTAMIIFRWPRALRSSQRIPMMNSITSFH